MTHLLYNYCHYTKVQSIQSPKLRDWIFLVEGPLWVGAAVNFWPWVESGSMLGVRNCWSCRKMLDEGAKETSWSWVCITKHDFHSFATRWPSVLDPSLFDHFQETTLEKRIVWDPTSDSDLGSLYSQHFQILPTTSSSSTLHKLVCSSLGNNWQLYTRESRHSFGPVDASL